jgi:FixJ family two-component response regulator
MPGMNGVELIDALEARQVTLPIIVITGYATTDLHDRLKRRGCQKILLKPFKASELIAAVHDVLLSPLTPS